MSIEDAYFKVFPVTLFECFDETTPMHFIFSLKKEYKRLEETVKILRHCGAKVGFKKGDNTNHSIIITDHNDVIEFYGPAFTIDFITDCLQLGKLQDIGKYRQAATSHLVKESDCMQVVYYRNFGWDRIIKDEDRRWIGHNYTVKLVKDESVACNGSQEDSIEVKDLCDKSVAMKPYSNVKIGINSKTRMDDDSDSISEFSDIAQRVTLESSNMKHSPVKDSLDDGNSSLEINPDSDRKVKSGMNSKIRMDDDTDSISEFGDIVQKVTLESSNMKHSPVKESNNIVKSIKSGYKPDTKVGETDSKFKSNSDSSPEDEEDEWKLEDLNKKRKIENSSQGVPKKASSEWMSKTSPLPLVKRSKLPLSLLSVGDSGSEEETKRVTYSKNTRRPYTKEERCKILNYIVSHHEYNRIKGRDLWRIMENRDVCPARTWQSMKEHFIKQILPNIDSYDCLTNEQKRRIKRAYY